MSATLFNEYGMVWYIMFAVNLSNFLVVQTVFSSDIYDTYELWFLLHGSVTKILSINNIILTVQKNEMTSQLSYAAFHIASMILDSFKLLLFK